MSIGLATAIALVCIAVGFAAGWLLPRGGRAGRDRPPPVRRILLPFTGQAISRRAFDAALRLAKAENATIMPAFLARVPRNLPLDAPLPAACAIGMPLLEAIEQDASSQGDTGRCPRRARTHLPGRAPPPRRARALRPYHRLRDRQPTPRPQQRRPRMAARTRSRRGHDPATRPGRRTPESLPTASINNPDQPSAAINHFASRRSASERRRPLPLPDREAKTRAAL